MYRMEGFSKTINCPSSEEILRFQIGDLSFAGGSKVRRHLLECEFCAAEFEFYELYPPGELKIVEADDIPEPLFQLATELLATNRDLATLYRLAGQS